ncbi:hypothetical protein [Pseudomonas sp. CGJS7]|uniref:hypothetical protein n=1 Tax=Pseudomonas sp. CGJS7 TaxID=3109348 RepID=UPI003008F4A3
MCKLHRLAMLVAALSPAWAHAGNAAADKADASLAGRYVLQDSQAQSELRLRADGSFELDFLHAGRKQAASGRWTASADGVALTSEPSRAGKPLFALDNTMPWQKGAKKALKESEAAHRTELIHAACAFVKTYDEGLVQAGASNAAAWVVAQADRNAARKADAEAALPAATVELERARAEAEIAIGTAIAARMVGAAQAGAAARAEPSFAGTMAATADSAVLDYLERNKDVGQLYATLGREMPRLREPAFNRDRCLREKPADVERPGYGIIMVYSNSDYPPPPLRVDFVYSDGQTERREIIAGQTPYAPYRAGTRLQRVAFSIDRAHADRPAETIEVDESKGRMFVVSMDTVGLKPSALGDMTLKLDHGDLKSSDFGGRYVRH